MAMCLRKSVMIGKALSCLSGIRHWLHRRQAKIGSTLLASVLFISALGWGVGMGSAFAQTANIQPFTTQTLDDVKQTLDGQGFILSLWSITCAPCRQDLEILAE